MTSLRATLYTGPRMLKFIFLNTLAIFLAISPLASRADEDSDFQKGIVFLQEKKAPEAMEAFRKALERHPNHPAILTNLGLAAFQAGQRGWAMAFLRQAEANASPFSATSRGIEFIQSKLEVKEIPHDIQVWEQVRHYLFLGVPLSRFAFLGAVVLLFVGVLFIRYFGARRSAQANEQRMPELGILHYCGVGLLALTLLLVWGKLVDRSEIRATVVEEKVAALSAPSGDAPSLFELFEGLEVRIKRFEKEWLQVQYPGGPTGWVLAKSVHVTQVQGWFGTKEAP